MNNCSPPTFVFTTPPPCPRQHYKKGKSRRCSAQGPKKKIICLDTNGSNGGGNQSGDRKRNFMEDVWKAMTPDMLNKLVDILVKDFNMSKSEACNFVKQQKDLSKQSQMISSGKCPCSSDMVPAIPNMDVRNAMVREFMDITACKVSDYMAMVLCSRKTRRYKVLSKLMLDNIVTMFGVHENDNTLITKLTAFIVDKLALWLDNLFDDFTCPEEENPKIEESTNEDEKREDAALDEHTEVKQEPKEEPEEPEQEAE